MVSPFGQGTNNAFGNTGGIFGNKTAATPGGNVFGGMNNQSSTSTPATTNVFGGPTAGAATTNVFGSRPTTPAFNFGGAATTTAALQWFCAIVNKPPLFNFTGSKESTPDPASVFGQQNRSGTSTPFSSGGVGAGVAGVAGNVFGQPGQQPGYLVVLLITIHSHLVVPLARLLLWCSWCCSRWNEYASGNSSS